MGFGVRPYGERGSPSGWLAVGFSLPSATPEAVGQYAGRAGFVFRYS